MKINNLGIQDLVKLNQKKNVKKNDENFGDILNNELESANNLKKSANKANQAFLTGKSNNLHEVMIAGQKAETAISFVVEVKNRIVDAYKEFARMQV
ncbi:MAG: flagellar hook-basal body complex protein FliE [Fusobacteriota bacterium]